MLNTFIKTAAAVGVAAAGTAGAVGMRGNMPMRHQIDPEVREAIETAVENKDFDAWITAHDNVGDERAKEMLAIIDTEGEFLLLVESHEARESGDFEKAREIAEELGLPFGGQRQGGERMGNRSNVDMEAVREATANGDYDGWKALHEDEARIFEIIQSESDFDKLVEMHTAMEAGDFETAQLLREELGMQMRGNMGRGDGAAQRQGNSDRSGQKTNEFGGRR